MNHRQTYADLLAAEAERSRQAALDDQARATDWLIIVAGACALTAALLGVL